MESIKEANKFGSQDTNDMPIPEPNIKYLSNFVPYYIENDVVDPRVSIIEKQSDTLNAVLGRTQIYFTLFKGMVGIGFLYLPIGYSYAGIAFSIIAFLICSFFSSEGFNRLVSAHEKVGGSYSELAEKAGGKLFKIVLEIALVISQVIGCLIVVDLYCRLCGVYYYQSK